MARASNHDVYAVLEKCRKRFGNTATAADVFAFMKSLKVPHTVVMTPNRRLAHALYALTDNPADVGPIPVHATKAKASNSPSTKPKPASAGALSALVLPAIANTEVEVSHGVSNVMNLPVAAHRARITSLRQITDNLVPEKMSTYVPFGHHRDIHMMVASKIFFPAYVTGLSGNGKTVMIEQICAQLKRPCMRVNITEETCEDDLIGGNTLVDGNVVFQEGPALTAMRAGAVLILDEVDLNAVKVLCLQAIMEGKPYLIKKTGELVYPQPGFNIFATANTKGRGSDTGRFAGAKYMNEAFMERFAVTFEQDYPPATAEVKILNKNFEELGIGSSDTEAFAGNLTKWADIIRKSFNEGAVDEIITTRRLVAVTRSFAIFKDRMKAIKLCLARFDSTTQESFLDLYTKVDETALNEAATSADSDAPAPAYV